jgi:hypothetical protein
MFGATLETVALVAAIAVHRATTGGCWATCLHGLVCDHATGTCVERPPCGGRCGPTQSCDQAAASERCVERPPADAGADAAIPPS